MGDFVFIPASAFSHGVSGRLWSSEEAVPLTWSAPALEEFVAAMERIERDFSSSWREADLPPGGAAGGAGERTGLRRHA
ncbi:hypothetical protein [Streptomyces sudanensis]|uniref:hypothetical protein n=1 Tax=Streptomyces sudanensis TaxID=436397 RepID=UPI0020CF67A8|nr:hypothetical protein [Streptomyces sudanensis]MCP9956344.1 hypothetical protein [Streptomyces sudanensis]MCQ0003039.1 hypothetical protein [Streptomyces sudanensis]